MTIDVGSVHRIESEIEARSPLGLLTQRPLLNEMIVYLDDARIRLMRDAEAKVTLQFSRSRLQATKAEFVDMIREGEQSLHKLCELVCKSFLPGYQMHSVVIGEIPSTGERFTLMQNVTSRELYATIDLDLGNRQLKKLKYFDGNAWVGPALVSNVVEYEPTETNRFAIHRLISRIKAEEELWNKVADEIFGLDTLVRRDKKLVHLSRFVKDVFGLKIVVGSVERASELHEALQQVSWADSELASLDIPVSSATRALEFLETKNYLGSADRKNSGWEALKSVVQWGGKMFEMQVQPLPVFLREKEKLTAESHAGFKSQREALRNEIAREVPLFSFYRDLLRWLFLDEGRGESPKDDRITIELMA